MNIETTIDVLNKIRFSVTCVGLVSNLISFIVLSRKTFQKNSISVYCRALAIADSFIISMQFANLLVFIFFNSNVFSALLELCKINFYIYVSFSAIAGWILVAFSLDKVLCVLYPTRYELIRKKEFQVAIIGIIFLFNLLVYIEVPIELTNSSEILFDNKTNLSTIKWTCTLKNIRFYKIVGIFYLFESSLIPFLIMTVTSLMTVKALFLSRARLQMLTESQSMRSRRMRDLKFAANSLVLNVLYVFLQMPICITYIVTIQDEATAVVFFYVASILYYINSSMSFFAHYMSNSIFRREFLKMLGLVKRAKNTVTTME